VAAPFTLAHFERWARRLILDTGEPWRLDEYQSLFAEDLFAGARECMLVVPEGNGKTTLIAGLGLYGLRFAPDALIPVAASSRDQARIMYRQAKGFLRRSRLDDDGFEFQAFDGYRRIDLRGEGRTKRGEVLGSIEVHAADAGTGDGIIPFPYAFLDELHRHRSLDLYETWRGKLDKRGAQIVTISTAGEAGGAFEEMRDRIRRETEAVSRRPGFVRCRSREIAFHEYALEEGAEPDDVEAVKRCNPLPAITVESLAAKLRSPTMSPSHWARFVCNRAARSEMAAIQEVEWWSAKTDAEIPAGEPVWLGLDVAWKWDTTAAVPLWWRDDSYRLLGPARILVPPRDGSSLHPSVVESMLVEVNARNPLHTVVMDTSRAEQLATWISDEFGALVIDRAQTHSFAVEDYDRFMEALREGWLRHAGDAGLTRHALNAIARVLPHGDARFDRPSSTRDSGGQEMRVIDALTAAAMAHSAAAMMQQQPAAPLVAFA
jgi:phage terminase large subunit-like protein